MTKETSFYELFGSTNFNIGYTSVGIESENGFKSNDNSDFYGCKTVRELAKLTKRFKPTNEKQVIKVLTTVLEEEVVYLLTSQGRIVTFSDYQVIPEFSLLTEEVCDFLKI